MRRSTCASYSYDWAVANSLVDVRHVAALGGGVSDPGKGPNALAMATRVVRMVPEELAMEAMGLEAPPRRQVGKDISGNREMQRRAARASINARAGAN